MFVYMKSLNYMNYLKHHLNDDYISFWSLSTRKGEKRLRDQLILGTYIKCYIQYTYV